MELENGFRIYYAGDTHVFGDMALIRQLFQPDLAMLPIGGHYTMDPAAAALAVELLGVRARAADPLGNVPVPRRDAGRAASRSSAARGARRTSSTGSRATRWTDGPGNCSGPAICRAGCDVRPDGDLRREQPGDQPALTNGSVGTPSRASVERPEGSRTRRPASQSWLTPGCMLWTITRSVSIEPGSATDTIATPSCSCTAGMSASV